MTDLNLNPRTWQFPPDRARLIAGRCRRNAFVAAVVAFVLAVAGAALAFPPAGVPVLVVLGIALFFNNERAKLIGYAAGFERGQITVPTLERRP